MSYFVAYSCGSAYLTNGTPANEDRATTLWKILTHQVIMEICMHYRRALRYLYPQTPFPIRHIASNLPWYAYWCPTCISVDTVHMSFLRGRGEGCRKQIDISEEQGFIITMMVVVLSVKNIIDKNKNCCWHVLVKCVTDGATCSTRAAGLI